MSEKVTVKEVRSAADKVVSLAREVGLIAADAKTELQEGSPTYGNAWRLLTLTEYGGRHSFPGVPGYGGYLGWTRREAALSLRTMYETMWYMQRVKHNNNNV